MPASASMTVGHSTTGTLTCFFFLPGGVGFFLLYYFSNNPSSKEDLWRSSSSLQNHQ